MLVEHHSSERLKCHHCGRPRTECSSPDGVWFPQRVVCRADMERAAAERAYDRLHEKAPFHDGTFKNWATEASAAFPYHYDDGVTVFVSEVDINPHDRFTTTQCASPDDRPSDQPDEEVT